MAKAQHRMTDDPQRQIGAKPVVTADPDGLRGNDPKKTEAVPPLSEIQAALTVLLQKLTGRRLQWIAATQQPTEALRPVMRSLAPTFAARVLPDSTSKSKQPRTPRRHSALRLLT